MVKYYPYDPNSIVRVEETATIKSGKVFLRHIPKQASIVIDGFAEVNSLLPQENQFSCQYALDSMYRDANRVLNFNSANNGQSITVSYIAIGTVFTADDANEIKAHMENELIHGGGSEYELPVANSVRLGGIKIGQDLQAFADGKVDVVHHSHFNHFDVLFSNASPSDESWSLNTLDDYGQYYSQIFEDVAGRLPTFGDIVHWRNSNGYAGYAIYIKRDATGEFLNLTRDWNDAQWGRINPILSVADREKLDALPYELPTASSSVKGGAKVGNSLIVTADDKLHVALGTTPLTIEGSMWIHVP